MEKSYVCFNQTQGAKQLLFFVMLPIALAGAAVTSRDAVIRAPAGGSEIVIKATSRMAGAIESLQWGGKEFINDSDHGRELQTCWNGNAGEEPEAVETFNPTEAGSLDDRLGATSSSRLLEIQARGNQLETLSQPAFWLNPSETSGGKPARNKTILSNDRLRKRVVIGCNNLPHAIDYQVTVSLAAEDRNTRCVIEALTGYMRPEFDRFRVFDAKTGKLAPSMMDPASKRCAGLFHRRWRSFSWRRGTARKAHARAFSQ